MRHKLMKFACILLGVALSCLATARLEGNNRAPNNNARPNLRLSLTPSFCSDTNAFFIFGDVGSRLYRANGTFGTCLTPSDRLKIGAEYLSEKLTFKFHTGNTHRWMRQWAYGGAYQHLVGCTWIYAFDLSASYSHAPGKRLRVVPPPDHSSPLAHQTITRRRIAGSDAWSVNAGATVFPWQSSTFDFSVVYDHVQYKKKFKHRGDNVCGIGGKLKFMQYLAPEVLLALTSELRHPYNYFAFELNWFKAFCCKGLNLGVYAGHTVGKKGLPKSTEGGFRLGFEFGVEEFYCNPKTPQSACCEMACNQSCQDFLCWMREPAVYMPEVLAKADEKTIENCSPPTSRQIPNAVVNIARNPIRLVENLAPYFDGGGSALSYHAIIENNLFVDKPAVAIDPTTGIIYISGESDGMLRIEVTASSACGQATELFEVSFVYPE